MCFLKRPPQSASHLQLATCSLCLDVEEWQCDGVQLLARLESHNIAYWLVSLHVRDLHWLRLGRGILVCLLGHNVNG